MYNKFMGWKHNNSNYHSNLMRNNLKRNFWERTKWNSNTAIYQILDNKKIQKWMPIPKEIINIKKEHNWHINKYKQSETENHTISAQQNLWDLFIQEFSIVKEKHQTEVLTLIDNFLNPKNLIYHNRFIKDMVTSLIQNESFVTTMLSHSLANTMQEWQIVMNTISDDNIADIRLNQLYQKLTISHKDLYNSKQLFSIQNFEYYKLYHYIDNLIFSEFLCQTLWIGGTNELLINNKLYSIYTASLHNDLYNWIDIILQDNDKNLIGIDITLSKKKKSGISLSQTDGFQRKFIANHAPIKKYFQKFYTDITEYIYGNNAQPMLDITYTIKEKKSIEQRISNIINLENNTIASPDQDTDNNAVRD